MTDKSVETFHVIRDLAATMDERCRSRVLGAITTILEGKPAEPKCRRCIMSAWLDAAEQCLACASHDDKGGAALDFPTPETAIRGLK